MALGLPAGPALDPPCPGLAEALFLPADAASFDCPANDPGDLTTTLSFTGGRMATPSFIRRFDMDRSAAGVGGFAVREVVDSGTGGCGGAWTVTGDVVLAVTMGLGVG